jgi:myo-inositol 2-dehydrogenase/D-chiro-inositol 1-dehydrogenase
MSVKIGIIGCGHMGNTHGKLLAQDERVELTGVVDIDATCSERLARELDTRAYGRMEDLLNENPTAVYVTTPNARHVEPVLGALEAGVHVFSEKPMATSLAEARCILEAVETSGLIYQIGFNRRFAPVYKFAKERIGPGFEPLSANVKMNRGELLHPAWVGNTELTGGFLYESTIHLLDMIRWLMGEVSEVVCRAQANAYDELDDFAMILTFESGHCCAFSSSAHTSWAFPFERIELYGKHAQIVTEEMEKVIYSPGLNETVTTRDYFQLSTEEKWGYREEDWLFVSALLGKNPPAVAAQDGYKAVELAEAVYRSARAGGQVVSLPLL